MTYAPPCTSSFQRKNRSLNKSRLVGEKSGYQRKAGQLLWWILQQVTFVRQDSSNIFQEINVWMAHQDGNLLFDCGEEEWMEKYGRKFTFSLGKNKVTRYQHVTLSKHSDSKAMDVNISIEVIPLDKMQLNTERIIIIK